MNNLKTYNEYLNEGFYDWLNKDGDLNFNLEVKETDKDGCSTSAIGFILMISSIFAKMADSFYIFIILMLAGSILNIPLFIYLFKKIMRNPYHYLRSKILLDKIKIKIDEIEEEIKKNPYIYQKINDIKLQMEENVKNKDKKAISESIHRLYLTLKEFKEFKEKDDEWPFEDLEKN